MRLATIHSRANVGLDAPPVVVEVHLSAGMPNVSIVGLPEKAVKESRDRVRAAIINSNFDFPSAGRITINLAPADLPKDGGRFDLPIALGILAASGQVDRRSLEGYEFIGELSLSGKLRPVNGILPVALQSIKAKRTLVIPTQNKHEATLVNDIQVITPDHLLDITAHLNGIESLPFASSHPIQSAKIQYPDLSEVYGQHLAKRALEIAAAGSHSMLMSGPPGTGKSMLASRLPSIMPAMSESEALESASIYSISRSKFEVSQWKKRPIRHPHHTSSPAAIVGGGSNPKPGEISLAHHGILFLDEMPEFDRKVLEVLREPLETGTITISRAARQAEFPARFQLIAAMNPCPCGYMGDTTQQCSCSSFQIQRYQSRISGPLIDRIDLHVNVPRSTSELFQTNRLEEKSEQVRERVCQAVHLQMQRQNCLNAALQSKDINKYCILDSDGESLMLKAVNKLRLSGRGLHRILKTARTIADLDHSVQIKTPHLSEAINFRKR